MYKDLAVKILDQIENKNVALPVIEYNLGRAIIKLALDENNWNKNRTAIFLGLKRTTLIERMNKFKLCESEQEEPCRQGTTIKRIQLEELDSHAS